MKKTSSLNLITHSSAWLAILFPFLIAAGKGPAEVGIILLAVFFVSYVVITKDFKFLKEKWVLASLVLWSYLVIRSFFTPDIKHALIKSFPFIRFILFAACLEFLASKDKKLSSRIFIALCIVLAFLILDGFIQFFVGYDLFGRPRIGSTTQYFRLTGPFSKQILGTTIASLGIIGIAGLIPLLKKSKNYLLLIFLSGSLIFTIVFLAGERAALLRLIFSTALLWLGLFLKAKDIQTKKNLWLFALFLSVLCLVLLKAFLFFAPGTIDRQISSSIREVTNSSASSYIFLWKTGINAGLSNILFGIGPNHFEFFCKAHPHSILPICGNNQMFFHPHNIWIELFAESGLLGLSLFLVLLYTLADKLIKFCATRSDLCECALVIGVGLAAFQRLLPFPSSGFFKNWYAIPIWFAIGWMLCIIRTRQSKS
jgi:O-antigen ligase